MDTLTENQARRTEEDFPPLQGIASPADPAFDLWLTHHLRQLYDPVVQEPIPRDLIKLLEARLK
jgi:Anti-sigma factor NepR